MLWRNLARLLEAPAMRRAAAPGPADESERRNVLGTHEQEREAVGHVRGILA